MIKKVVFPNWFALALFLVAGGLVSVGLKYELFMDFVNYHYFNAWAFLNNRINYDVAIAGFNAFFNPLIELPLYFLIKYFNNLPDVVYFSQGLWAGALAFVFFKLSGLFFDIKTPKGTLAIFLTLLIALSGPAFFLQIGTSTNEIQVSFLIMSGFYLLVREIFVVKSGKLFKCFLPGLLMGIALALKPTVFVYCVAAGGSLILCYKKIENPIAKIATFASAGLLGYLIFNGFWMLEMWERFQNPFFPFANKIFKSDYFPPINFADNSYLPRSLGQYLLWPLYLTTEAFRRDGMMFVFDFRPAVVYLILIVCILKIIWSFFKKTNLKMDENQLFLISFVVISYLLWMSFFSITRYYIVIEMLTAIFIVQALLLFKIPKSLIGEALYYSIFLLFLFMLVSTCYFSDSWGKRDWDLQSGFEDKKFVNIEKVNLPDNTLILFYDNPASLALPFLSENAKNIRGVSVSQNFNVYMYKNGIVRDMFDVGKTWRELRESIIKNHQGPKVAMIAENSTDLRSFDITTDKYLTGMECQTLRNNLKITWYLCVPPELKNEVWDIEKGE